MTGDWLNGALCSQVGTEMFFPEKGGSTRDPKFICARCPVRGECLIEAMIYEQDGPEDHRHGIYGGLSVTERIRLADDGWTVGDPIPDVTGGLRAKTCPHCLSVFSTLSRHVQSCAAGDGKAA